MFKTMECPSLNFENYKIIHLSHAAFVVFCHSISSKLIHACHVQIVHYVLLAKELTKESGKEDIYKKGMRKPGSSSSCLKS
jgi:hypothetical protein